MSRTRAIIQDPAITINIGGPADDRSHHHPSSWHDGPLDIRKAAVNATVSCCGFHSP